MPDQHPSPTASRRSTLAVGGLLVVCAALAVGLVVSAYLNHQAATRAADAVLRSRVRDVGSASIALVRVSRRLRQPIDLDTIAKDIARDGIEVAFLDARKKRVVAASSANTDSEAEIPMAVRLALRTSGEAFRDRTAHLEFWRPVYAGRGGRRRWRRFMRHMGRRHPGAHGPHGPRRPPRRKVLLLRARIPRALASDVVAPARRTLVVSSAAALLLLLSALWLFRAARRARRIAAALRRSETLSSLGEMAAVLAHEIRTPLASMKGNAQLIAEETPEDTRPRAIVTEAARLERLVNGMLDVARPGALDRDAIDPDALAERTAEMLAPRAHSLGVNLLTDPGDLGPCLQGDRDKLLQVLANLLQNAIQAHAAAGSADPVVVQVRGSRGGVTFTILDRGEGLTEPVERLLRPFFSTKQGGTGLGLSVARQLVEQHGGSLSLAPRSGGGVSAQVQLPKTAAVN